ncbi:polyhydroxyalkanoate depolymerase [Teredinibacter turnerae]|uniref:Polyhydroxyalkanoate depolymerase, intracellular n=1 Tax=Teredinibacter turnerae (strain ATCC 39867 / T7901) TaxID=377629 RepID=C5BHY2_TERTT|nr:polyhydroxyalkanoate depolymerase [Teredinibacter turnerae]ACR11999.1 polyhydroxyalkanoate depolymerase, intracellular [Teredinibacter turnerae T7901]
MLYHAYEVNHAALAPWREIVGASKRYLESPLNPASYTWAGRTMAAACDLFEVATRRYEKPEWGLYKTDVNGETVDVSTRVIWEQPFCRLLHFQRDSSQMCAAYDNKKWADPRVLLVAPLSGHYATLLRRTVDAFLPDHEVYVTDWADAREVPLSKGRFDFNDYIDYIMAMFELLGPDTHVIGICQPGPPVLAAVAVMSAENNEFLPASMTFMGSPIDTRQSPTLPNKVALERSYGWFRDNMIYSVPWPNKGFMRRVYPGFLQLSGFITMNQERHVMAHRNYFEHLVEGDCDSVHKHREFYDEYLAVLDLTEEFYLQTIRVVFQDHCLAKGTLRHRGHLVDPATITKVALMTVEGEKDDISGIGQTQAAHTLCPNIPQSMQTDYVQPGVGHYGVFSGSRFRNEIQPRIAEFIRAHFNRSEELAFKKENPLLFFAPHESGEHV